MRNIIKNSKILSICLGIFVLGCYGCDPVYRILQKEGASAIDEIQEDYRNLIIQKLKEMVPEEARNWCTPQTSILEGQPYDALAKYAESKDVDMIVMGIRGHGLVKTLFLGSTTDRVVRRAPCPVLSVGSMVSGE